MKLKKELFAAGCLLWMATKVPAQTEPAITNSPPPAVAPSDSKALIVPEENFRALSNMVVAGQLAEAQKQIEDLLVVYGDDPKLIQIKARLEKRMADIKASTPPAATEKIEAAPAANPEEVRKQNALRLVWKDGDLQKEGSPEREKLRREFTDSSAGFLAKFPDNKAVWLLRAQAALELCDPKTGWSAGKRLREFGLESSPNEFVQQIFAQLEREGWLADDLGAVIETTLKKVDKQIVDANEKGLKIAASIKQAKDTANFIPPEKLQEQEENTAALKKLEETRAYLLASFTPDDAMKHLLPLATVVLHPAPDLSRDKYKAACDLFLAESLPMRKMLKEDPRFWLARAQAGLWEADYDRAINVGLLISQDVPVVWEAGSSLQQITAEDSDPAQFRMLREIQFKGWLTPTVEEAQRNVQIAAEAEQVVGYDSWNAGKTKLHLAAEQKNWAAVKQYILAGGNLRTTEKNTGLPIVYLRRNFWINDGSNAVECALMMCDRLAGLNKNRKQNLSELLYDVAKGYNGYTQDSPIFTQNKKTFIEGMAHLGADLKLAVGGNAKYSLLHAESVSSEAELVRTCITLGADVNATNSSGSTPLHLLAAATRYDSTRKKDYFPDWALASSKLLLELKANPNLTDILKNTPLHIAAQNEYADWHLVDELLKAGANPAAINAEGKTPYQISKGASEKKKLLKLK